jgi:hypothetical protein
MHQSSSINIARHIGHYSPSSEFINCVRRSPPDKFSMALPSGLGTGTAKMTDLAGQIFSCNIYISKANCYVKIRNRFHLGHFPVSDKEAIFQITKHAKRSRSDRWKSFFSLETVAKYKCTVEFGPLIDSYPHIASISALGKDGAHFTIHCVGPPPYTAR